MKKKLLLIGAGPTSSLIFFNIQNSMKLKNLFKITILEKSSAVGGRFWTSRSRYDSRCYADLGAQYLTFSGDATTKPYFENLIENKLLSPFETKEIPGFKPTPQNTHYLCLNGTSSIVEHFFGQMVTGIFQDANVTRVTTDSGEEEFDIVVSTIPVPQLLQLTNIDNILQGHVEIKMRLHEVKYNSRYALIMFYDDINGPFTTDSNSSAFSAINFTNDPNIRYWSVENFKRCFPFNQPKEPCAIVFHSSVKFGANQLENTSEDFKKELLQNAQKCLNIVPMKEPSYIKYHWWKYSQVETPFNGIPGYIKLSNNILATGDGFSKSGFEGCIIAANKTVDHLENMAN